MMPAQKIHGFFQDRMIFLLSNLAGTGTDAAADVVIEAGAFLSNIFGQRAIAMAQGPDLLHQIQSLAHGKHAGVWAKIAGFILCHLTGDKDAGKCLIDCRLDIGILLVIL